MSKHLISHALHAFSFPKVQGSSSTLESDNCPSQMDTQESCLRILMFPWLAHGHIFPFLNLSKTLLKRKNFHIYICTTSINFDSIQNFINTNLLNTSIELIQLPLESSPELPPHYHTTKNLPSHLKFTLVKALQKAHSSFSDIVTSLKPDLVLYDLFQPWAAKAAASHGIPAVYFSVYGAMSLSFMHHRYVFGKGGDFPFPFDAIRVEEHVLRRNDFLLESLSDNIFDVDQEFLFGILKQSCDVVLVNSSRGIEGKYIDYLSTLCNKKILPVGPPTTDNVNMDDSETMQWLSKKSDHSTLFISFGSEYFLSRIETEEIAKGLELCDVNFIWIIRLPADGHGISLENALPEGFLERVGERGMVVTGWAPQPDILRHPSTGGFMSHCGWNSVTESMYFGVPVIAMPMKFEQPLNARMLVDAGICVEVWRNENEGFNGEEIAKAVERAFGEGSGEELRRRARELSEELRREEDEVLDGVAEELWQLCLKHKMHGERN